MNTVQSINGGVTTATPLPPNVIQQSFADHTRKVVDEVIENVCTELRGEVTVLREQLDQMDRTLVERASKTRDDMLSFIELVKHGRDLTSHISNELGNMRAKMNAIDDKLMNE